LRAVFLPGKAVAPVLRSCIGDILLHVYVRKVTKINSSSKGKVTYKLEDVRDDLITKFKESEGWRVLSNKPTPGGPP